MTDLLLINQYFHPDMAATAQLLSDLAEDCARSGFRVRAVASRGAYAPGRDGRLGRRELWRGVEIRRVPASDLGRRRLSGRMADYSTFLGSATAALLFGRRADVVVCLSTPPLVAALGLVARAKGSRFVYKVEDLYPEVAVALGTLRPGGLAARFLSWASRRLLARADAVVALDGAMAEALRARGARRVEVIPNWADGEAIRPDRAAGRRFREEEGLGDRFVVLYSGNLGLAHRFDRVCEAVRELGRETPEALFLFVGGGPRLPEVRESLAGLANVRFLPYQPRRRLGELYSAADLHLITLRDEVAGLLVPSKYAAALAAGRPVLLVGGEGTDMQREIRTGGLGWVCPHEGRAVARAIREAQSNRKRASEMGSRGRQLFAARYSRRVCVGRWLELLSDLAGDGRAPRRADGRSG